MKVLRDAEIPLLFGFDLIYLASPYSKYKHGIDAAAFDVAKISGRLISRGVKVYSPIVHTHHIAVACGIDPYDHDLWMKVDEAFMHKSDALIVCRMLGWEESFGVNEEIKNFTTANKPIFGIDPGMLR